MDTNEHEWEKYFDANSANYREREFIRANSRQFLFPAFVFIRVHSWLNFVEPPSNHAVGN
jgi:hypothetical protein